MSRLVIICGHSPASNLGLARTVGKLGCSVVILCNVTHSNQPHPEVYSKYVEELHFLDPQDKEGTILFMKSKYGDRDEKAILVPTSDVAANFIDSECSKLEDFFYLPRLDHSICDSGLAMDKSFQKQMAAKAGFNVLGSWIVDARTKDFIIPEGVQFPCFTKGVMSINTPKRFLTRCDSKEQLQKHLSKIASERPSMIMVEQFAHIGKEYGLMAFCNGKDVYIPALTEFSVIGKGPFPGVSIQGISHPIDTTCNLYQTAVKFLQSFNFVGLCNIDLFEIDGEFYFSELNIRYAAYCYSLVAGGSNIISMYIDSLCGKGVRPKKMERDVVYYNEYVALNDIISLKLSLGQARKIQRSSDAFVMNDKDDPKPYRDLRLDCFNRFVSKTFRRFSKLLPKLH